MDFYDPTYEKYRATIEQNWKRDAWVKAYLPHVRLALQAVVRQWGEAQATGATPFDFIVEGDEPPALMLSLPKEQFVKGILDPQGVLEPRRLTSGHYKVRLVPLYRPRPITFFVECDGLETYMQVTESVLGTARVHVPQGEYPDYRDFPKEDQPLMATFSLMLQEQDTKEVAAVLPGQLDHLASRMVWELAFKKFPHIPPQKEATDG